MKNQAVAKGCGGLFSTLKGRKRIIHFLVTFGVYITGWKTQWKMCKTQKRGLVDEVTDSLCKILRNNILAEKSRQGDEIFASGLALNFLALYDTIFLIWQTNRKGNRQWHQKRTMATRAFPP